MFSSLVNNYFIRFLVVYCKYLMAKYKYRHNVIFNGFTVIFAFKGSTISLGKGENKTTINSSSLSNMVGLSQRTIIVARHGGKIHIGYGCGISGSTIYAMDNIHIGNHVLIGGNCKIIDNDFHPLHVAKRNPQKPEDIKRKRIFIDDGCFIGANSIILKGTTLGKNVVVGAGSVVHGTFPDNVIIAGNPARKIGDNVK